MRSSDKEWHIQYNFQILLEVMIFNNVHQFACILHLCLMIKMSVQFKVLIFILIFISVFTNVFNFKFILFLESILDIRYICTCIFITKALIKYIIMWNYSFLEILKKLLLIKLVIWYYILDNDLFCRYTDDGEQEFLCKRSILPVILVGIFIYWYPVYDGKMGY